jgi:hypothetical protein
LEGLHGQRRGAQEVRQGQVGPRQEAHQRQGPHRTV